MTKDRRLGRGLAALLGTPLEEDAAREGAHGAVTMASPAGVQRPVASPTPAARATTGPTTARPAGGAPSPVVPSAVGGSSPAATDNRSKAASVAGQAGHSRATTNSHNGQKFPPDSVASKASSRPSDRTGSSSNPTASVGKPAPQETQRGPQPTDFSAAEEATQADRQRGGLVELDVDQIENNPFQPRRRFNEEEIASLAESIREHQQLQPILVRRVGERYQLISGERRLRATIHAGLTRIRAEIREADDRLVAELAIVENLQRKDLDAIEKAMSFRRYIDQHQCTQEDLAKRLKIDRSTIANLMRLLELPAPIQEAIQADRLTAGHARALLPLGEEEQQIEFARLIKEEGWSVRETERHVNEQLAAEDGVIAGSTQSSRSSKRTSPQIASLEQQLRLVLGTKVEIKQNASGRGKIAISFANNEEFERLCSLICPETQRRAA